MELANTIIPPLCEDTLVARFMCLKFSKTLITNANFNHAPPANAGQVM